jgi:hypothetical protein
MRIICGIVVFLAGLFIFGYGCEVEKGGAYWVIGIILVFTGYKVIRS